MSGSGIILIDDSGSDGGETPPPDGGTPSSGPSVTIQASPLEGDSPLTVQFRGNAVSDIEIDDDRTTWDFDVDDGILVDATTRNASHTYTVSPGQSRRFIARLTMYDIENNGGIAEVAISVVGPQTGDGGGLIGGNDFRIIAGVAGNPDFDVDEGTSPFDVLLSVDASSLSGDLQSIAWDLGDGTRASSLVVPHTYVNESEETQRIAISAVVITTTSGGATNSSVATKLLTVHPGQSETNQDDPSLPGTGAQGPGGSSSPCGAMGFVTLIGLFGGIGTLRLVRRRRVR